MSKRNLNGTQATRKYKNRNFKPYAPVEKLIAKFEENNPGHTFAVLMNKAAWELLKPLAGKSEHNHPLAMKLERWKPMRNA